jgi:Beta propeller domain
MKRVVMAAITIVIFVLGMTGCNGGTGNTSAPAPVTVQAAAPKKALRAFTSDQELKNYLKDLADKQRRQNRLRVSSGLSLSAPMAAKVAAPSGGYADESITNVQHAGVDEGGIVKLHGDHLVVLHRGRLFTVDIGGDDLTPISSVDAFGPDIDPRGTWYDEMLVSQDTIVVIGYSYERGGTEVGLFHIDTDGNLAYESTYHLRSNDYYSSRNYASRLIGSKLIFYSPLYLNLWGGDPFDSFPAVRKWHRGATNREFRRIVPATQIYRPENPIDDAYGTALHTVTICDLAAGNFDCKATSVIGPPGRVFYVSPQAVYVWVTGWVYQGEKAQSKSMLYRMPLDGSSPSAVGVSGSPVDQFSFLESEDGFLNVLIRIGSAGDSMWNAEGKTAGTALLRMPLASFSDGTQSIPASSYQKLPNPPGYALQNRFVGDYLLYGTGSGWWYPQKKNTSDLYAVQWTNGDVHKITLLHGIDRIEQMGDAAVVVGTDGADLHFSAVSPSDLSEKVFDYVRKGASQGELRSHGFFYKPEDQGTGMLGLPISAPGRPGYGHLFQNSSAILFLRNDKLRFREVGELEANPEKAKDDRCRASCVDWYGNSQPLFVHGRVIALLGYELVEGSVEDGQIQEKRRINYGPQSVTAAARSN